MAYFRWETLLLLTVAVCALGNVFIARWASLSSSMLVNVPNPRLQIPHQKSQNMDLLVISVEANQTTTTARPRFICHLGPPKTATTTIQSVLQDKAWDSFRRRDAIVYLSTIDKGRVGA